MSFSIQKKKNKPQLSSDPKSARRSPTRLTVPLNALCVQLIIGGLGKIDLNDWKANTRLKHCVADSNIVKWFWQAVESFDEERRGRLLQFVTGSTRVPLQGFKALQGG